MEHSKKEIAGSLLLLQKTNGKSIAGRWSVCSFAIESDDYVSEDMLLEAFSLEINMYYLGDKNIALVIGNGEYNNPIIYFLIPTKHVGEFGKLIFTLPTLHEE